MPLPFVIVKGPSPPPCFLCCGMSRRLVIVVVVVELRSSSFKLSFYFTSRGCCEFRCSHPRVGSGSDGSSNNNSSIIRTVVVVVPSAQSGSSAQFAAALRWAGLGGARVAEK